MVPFLPNISLHLVSGLETTGPERGARRLLQPLATASPGVHAAVRGELCRQKGGEGRAGPQPAGPSQALYEHRQLTSRLRGLKESYSQILSPPMSPYQILYLSG